MKAIINSFKRTYWFKALVAFLICLLLLTFPSCQKEDENLFNQQSINGMDRMAIKASQVNAPLLYYGHEIFTRVKGKPFVVTQKIENPNFELFNDSFVLMILNGDNKKTRVSSAEIRIDGKLIAGPKAFSKNVSFIKKRLHKLTPESVLTVKLNGTPGSFIDLWIEGTLKEEMTVTDKDGNVYKTVTIGTQVWMAENLKTTKFNDGNPIPLITAKDEWYSRTGPAYCWYDNNPNENEDVYGALYNWFAVNTGKLCPIGWHVSTVSDWAILINYLGPEVAALKLKEVGTEHWAYSPNGIGTNESGFTALPAGYRWWAGNVNVGDFGGLHYRASWWLSTEYDSSSGSLQNFRYDFPYMLAEPGSSPKINGNSVRCVKD
jgi:uncharacterized protein (TIGR02145 family)